MSKPIFVDGWNPFDSNARYGVPATVLLLLGCYVGARVLFEKKDKIAATATNGLGAHYHRVR